MAIAAAMTWRYRAHHGGAFGNPGQRQQRTATGINFKASNPALAAFYGGSATRI